MNPAYRIVILSLISVYEENGSHFTIDLWARDLEKQAEVTDVVLLCPVKTKAQPDVSNSQISQSVKIYAYDQLTTEDIDEIISHADVIQVPGNFGWKNSKSARRLIRAAKRNGKKSILGVSSNRARSTLINASGKGMLRLIKGCLRYLDIRTSQSWLAINCDGISVVGDGVSALFKYTNKNIHVGIASWISATDIVYMPRLQSSHTIKLCMAGRLEQMKGMHLGVLATQLLAAENKKVSLTIIGEGPEKNNLEKQVASLSLSSITKFIEPVAYPGPFFNMLDAMDIVLLTNLGDEQPRLIFDALARGCLPLCPYTLPYQNLGLDSLLLYEQGNAKALYEAIKVLLDPEIRQNLRAKMLKLAQTFTIEQMHNKRAEWIKSLIK